MLITLLLDTWVWYEFYVIFNHNNCKMDHWQRFLKRHGSLKWYCLFCSSVLYVKNRASWLDWKVGRRTSRLFPYRFKKNQTTLRNFIGYWKKDCEGIFEYSINTVREYWCVFVLVSFLHASIKNWCICLNSPS